mgnify:CR=1 FL=1
MTLIAEFEVSTPLLQETRRLAPDVVLELDSLYATRDCRVKMIIWVVGRDHEQFVDNLERDSTVAEMEVLADINGDDRCLCVVLLTEDASDLSSYWQVMEADIAWLRVTVSGETGTWLIRIHDRERLAKFVQGVKTETGESIRLTSLYDEDGDQIDEVSRSGLSGPQLEALTIAYDMGYFDNPRQTTLGEIGERIGISSGAVSGRIRRGVKTAVGDLVHPNGGHE